MYIENWVESWKLKRFHGLFVYLLICFRQKDWQSVDTEAFTIRGNNQRSFSLKELIEEGNYNVLMQNQPLYNNTDNSFKSSHDLFRSAFDQGFPWELIEVFSGKFSEYILILYSLVEMKRRYMTGLQKHAEFF